MSEMIDEKPRHGEIRQTKCEAVEEGWLVEYTLYLDRRCLIAWPGTRT